MMSIIEGKKSTTKSFLNDRRDTTPKSVGSTSRIRGADKINDDLG